MPETLSDNDLRAVADLLGSQYALVHCPPITFPWFSSDETAGITVDQDAGEVRIVTSGPLDLATRRELAAALVATILQDPEANR